MSGDLQVDEILAGEAAAIEAFERAQTHPDALHEGLAALASEPARRAYLRVIQKAIEGYLPAAGKATAVGLYCAGIVTREATERAFARHPEWRHA